MSSRKIVSEKLVDNKIIDLVQYYLGFDFSIEELQQSLYPSKRQTCGFKARHTIISISVLLFLLPTLYYINVLSIIFGIRCILPNNYFVWEATRPISNCTFCSNVSKPIVLQNISKQDFDRFAFLSTPIIVRNAFWHWPAMKKFNWHFFKQLYMDIEESYKTVDEECQFLHFKSDFISIKDVFSMSEARIRNLPNQKSWYVGWGNCHPLVLEEMRKYYPKPHFLPEEAEIPHKEYIFMGYDDGATMHLDFINRLMWQAQLKGEKEWHLIPPPECQAVCQPVEFKVFPGDGVDTRIWYHATTIPKGQFSLSVQSEYG
ncbi:hypothetical protein GWI33_012558 [Rhynchophorus ferrugineus]|uniref:Cupin-like domain-containing protein n=1 Tax=Rhynchophorus ferrugineus TaxID=354439 RepID=A0A834I570_RHYFE|nr:hypothetical protein GWI33_012558 [Rhynchophorus ferrugineus]